VYNSINKINNFAQFKKIFIDEAHHIIKPEIYYNEDDTNSECDSDDEYLDCNSDFDEEDESEGEEDESEEEKDAESNHEEILENYLTKIRKLKKYNNNVFLSATIDKIDEYEYYSKDIRDMINEGYLCDYNIHIPIFSGSVDAINDNINVCKHVIQNYRNIIIYCNTKKEGIEINRIMNDLLPLCSEYIDCDTKRNDRNTILEKFKSGEVPFLVNVKILVEGFNAPIAKGVCFLHMPSSKTAIIQIIGRALRLHDDKTIANVILPFASLEDEKSINNFLRILANNDARIKQSYDRKKIGGYISIHKVEDDCDTTISDENSCEFRFTMI
jgi:superfamily II DNA or RNA helicase